MIDCTSLWLWPSAKRIRSLRGNRGAKGIKNLLSCFVRNGELALAQPLCHHKHVLKYVQKIMYESGRDLFAPLIWTWQKIRRR